MEMIPANFIDTSQLSLGIYQYRLIAEDEQGNQSASSIKEVYTYDNGLRGTIIDFNAQVLSHNNQTMSEQGGSPSVSASGQESLSKYPDVLLTWDYETDYPSSLLNFKVYRLDTDHELTPAQLQDPPVPFITIATLNPHMNPYLNIGEVSIPLETPYHYLQTTQETGKRYAYYKIIAWHRDNGFSQWSNVVRVQMY